MAEKLRIKVLKRVTHRPSNNTLRVDIYNGRQRLGHGQDRWFSGRISLTEACSGKQKRKGNTEAGCALAQKTRTTTENSATVIDRRDRKDATTTRIQRRAQ